MTDVRIENLVKQYGSVTALKQVSVHIPDGSLTAILGPSGCGKTTLLRCIAGLLMPNEGKILIGRQDVTFVEPYRRNLGMVFQRPSMFPHMTVFQNIAWGLSLRRWKKSSIPDRVREMLRLVRLEGMENRKYNQLSGGQAQRVVIARALAPSPDLLLLDEPLSALDAKLRQELLLEIAEIHVQTGCTTLLVTHDQAEALTVADNLLLMDAGQIVQQGTPLDVYRHPQNLFSASFIGTNNLLPCTIVDWQNKTLTLQLEGSAIRLIADAPDITLQPGQAVWACVRADDIDLIQPEAGLRYPNVLTVRIQYTALTGGIVRVDGELEGYPVCIHVGGSERFRLLNGNTPESLLCAPGHISVVPRDEAQKN